MSSSSSADPLVLPLRLQKFLSRCGVASRRGSEKLMSAERVTVNGITVTALGSKVNPTTDEVRVDGILVKPQPEHCYLMLHKPAGYLTTMADPHGRPTIKELVPTQEHPGLFPVGRLDFDTTGLLLLMTDGELAHRLLHPRRHVFKRYIAIVDGLLSEDDAQLLRQGVHLDDGPSKPAQVHILSSSGSLAKGGLHLRQAKKPNTNQRLAGANGKLAKVTTTVQLEISEGRKRQVKRMLAYVGRPVLQLHRSAFGPLQLGDLAQGQWRPLTNQEITALRECVEIC